MPAVLAEAVAKAATDAEPDCAEEEAEVAEASVLECVYNDEPTYDGTEYEYVALL